MIRQNLLPTGLIRWMVVTAALFILAAPAVAQASADGSGIGAGRLLPTAAAVAGLAGVVLGGLALSRFRRTGSRRARAIVGGVLGLISILIGVLHAANSAGGFGTGNGLAGAIVAIGLGLIALILGWLALARLRRIVTDGGTSATANPGERR